MLVTAKLVPLALLHVKVSAKSPVLLASSPEVKVVIPLTLNVPPNVVAPVPTSNVLPLAIFTLLLNIVVPVIVNLPPTVALLVTSKPVKVVIPVTFNSSQFISPLTFNLYEPGLLVPIPTLPSSLMKSEKSPPSVV